MRKWMDAWGAYLLAALCIAVILFSALWTRSMEKAAPPGAQALSDGSQRLSQVTPQPTAPPLHRPCGGAVERPFSQAPLYFEATGLWLIHPAVDFAAAAGDPVFALLSGTARIVPEGLRLEHGEGLTSLYRGMREIAVRDGQAVQAGDRLGWAGGSVPFEGDGHLCVALLQDDAPVDFWHEDAAAP